MPGGYMGKLLFVDLTSGRMDEEALDEALARDYIGGYGIGARVLYDRMKAGTDPLAPEAILGFVTGPLTGSPALSASRYTVVGRSPLTGTWGDANSGGDFGPYLKSAGYDAVFFTGVSPQPVCLVINEGKAELRPANGLWGLDAVQTDDTLRRDLGPRVRVACIGQAGERQSRMACVINNKGRAAGRSGLGALMGNKRLKAIAVIGGAQVPLARRAEAEALRRKYLAALPETGGVLYQVFSMFGTCITNAPSVFNGDSPIKNWDGVGMVDFPDPDPISGQAVIARQQKKYGCWHCTIACGGHMMGPAGEYDYAPGSHKPEYETWCSFGSLCLNSSFESIVKVNDICNRYGLDTISTGVTVAFAIECFERGIIDEKDTGGIRLGWGNHQGIVALTETIAGGEGFGAVLADGVKRAAERIGRGSDQYAMHVQGQEVPMHDPKMSPFHATTYQMDATPARHTQGAEGWLNPVGLPLPEYDSVGYSDRGEAHKMAANASHVVSCAGLCVFGAACSPVEALVEFMSAVTGYDRDLDELLLAGERIANMRHLFNLREGLNPLEYKVPGRILGKPQQQAGPLAGKEVDSATLARDFCLAMQWDPVTAQPNAARLKALGLP